MIAKGAFAIIETNHQEILLIKRKDIPFWDLPGGKIKINESEAHCTIRENLKETGLIVSIDYFVGIYEQKKETMLSIYIQQ